MIATLLVVALAAAPEPKPVHVDKDTLGCVTEMEAQHAGGRNQRAVVERRWGVQGLGELAYLPIFDVNAWVYPLCGIANIDDGFAFAAFNKRGQLRSSGFIDQGNY